MFDPRKNKAIQLRQLGYSIKAIAKELNAAQSSVSIWVREVILTDLQVAKLQASMHSPEAIEKRRQARLASELLKRTAVIDAAILDITSLTQYELFVVGIALYWAEGSKTQSTVQLTNGDPNMVRLMMVFFREVCAVDENKLRGHIHIHESLNVEAAEVYWQRVTNIPKDKFYKTYSKPNKSSKGLRHSLPYGVCGVTVLDSRLLLRLRGWAQGIYQVGLKV